MKTGGVERRHIEEEAHNKETGKTKKTSNLGMSDGEAGEEEEEDEIPDLYSNLKPVESEE